MFLDLTSFLEKLDARYEEKVKKEGILVARKTRKRGIPTDSYPLQMPQIGQLTLNGKVC